MDADVTRTEESMSDFKRLISNPRGYRPLGRPRRRQKDNIRIDIMDILSLV